MRLMANRRAFLYCTDSYLHRSLFSIETNKKLELRPGYDLPATEKCFNRWQIVERTYDWSQRSWVIARAKLVAARSCAMLKPSHAGLRPGVVFMSGGITYDGHISKPGITELKVGSSENWYSRVR